MKYFCPYSIFILFVTLILTGSCGQNDYPSSLYKADSLASANPDSAIIFLAQLEDEMKEENEHTRMYYSLLKLKANDKAYVTHTSDSIIMPIVEYYEDRDDKRHLPEAYYYAGRVYSDLGDALQALEYFYKGKDAIGERTDIQYLTLKGYILTQTGYLLVEQGLYENAIQAFKESYRIREQMNDSIKIINNLKNIGHTYYFLKETDSALFYHNKAYDLAVKYKQFENQGIISYMKAEVYMSKGELDKAHKNIIEALKNISKPSENFIYTAALEYYRAVDAEDSVLYFVNKIMEKGDGRARWIANRALAEIYFSSGDISNGISSWSKCVEYSDSSRIASKTEYIIRYNTLYNYQLREKENAMLEAENKDKTIVIIVSVSSVLLLAILVLLLIIYIKKKKAEHEIDKKEIEYNRSLIQQHEERISNLRETLLKQYSVVNNQQREEIIKFEKKNWDDLALTLKIIDNKFINRLIELYPGMKSNDMKVCMLERLKFTNNQMADIMNVSVDAIKKRKQRMKSKYFMNFSTEHNLDSILDFIANGINV